MAARRLYEIKADYRKHNPNKPSYYVLGETAKEAKERFKMDVPWLDVYECAVCEDSIVQKITQDPEWFLHYIII